MSYIEYEWKCFQGVTLVTFRNSSCGKVMFLHACVKNSVHGGGVYPSMHWVRDVYLSMHWARGVYPRMHWAKVCVYPSMHPPAQYMLGYTHPLGRHPPPGQTPPQADPLPGQTPGADTPPTATAADGTHTTGMHYCSRIVILSLLYLSNSIIYCS